MRVVVGITGASGVVYAISLLKNLDEKKYLIMSETAKKIIMEETKHSISDVQALVDECYENNDLFSPLASGSTRFDAVVIVPCSLSTLSKIAHGIGDNLITRVAAVCMKEKRKLILVPRETPINTIHLENMVKLSQNGAIILPAMPAFYHKPKKIDDMIDFIVGKILDALDIKNDMYKRWREE
jgi:4-hydroxy-3-polyprenylbenzoate decarboxylase